jgi:hypothetical protein
LSGNATHVFIKIHGNETYNRLHDLFHSWSADYGRIDKSKIGYFPADLVNCICGGAGKI